MIKLFHFLKYISFCLFSIAIGSNAIALKKPNKQIWRQLDPNYTLVIDTSKGRIIIEMRPEFAQKSIERIKLLSRENVYDGLQFHRVIAGFVAQTGNPNNRDGGTSAYPNLAPEMMFKHAYLSGEIIASQTSDSASGLIGSVPFQSTPITSALKGTRGSLRAWGAHCKGVAGMGRGEARDSANSEIYFMLDSARRLDKDYTVFGRIVIGMDVLEKLQIGEPPAQPDIMNSVRLLADIPPEERPKVSVLSGDSLTQLIKKTRLSVLKKGADFSVCDVEIPAKLH